MADLNVHRPHTLGRDRALTVAQEWVAQAQSELGLSCTWVQDQNCDRVTFSRAGVQGHMLVASDHFALEATLGFLFKAFAPRIQQEMEQQLDQALLAAGNAEAGGSIPGEAST